jgi:WD40 repeat protein
MPDFPEELQPDVIPEFVLPAPDSSVFLYTRCVEQTFSDGSQQCPGGIAMTLYDATTQTIIADLPRAAIDISGYDIFEERSLPVQRKAEWSAGGRYLAYASVPETTAAQFDLHIRDMTTGDIIVPTFPNERVNYQSGLNWSPVAPHLLFWIEGRAGEDTAADNPEETRHAVIYDVASGEFVIADTPYDFSEDIIVHSVRWSADGQGLVFVDGRQNLIHMDTQTGSTTPIDTGVQRVLDRVAVP